MKLRASLAILLLAIAPSLIAQDAQSRQLVDLANRERAAAGLKLLAWDPTLAAAAYNHAVRMSQEGPISHRYGGEPDLAQRAASAGAKFSLIEENIAVGQSPSQVHSAWMHSPGHHDNLLNPDIDRIGVAIVPARGVLYAVADYAQAVAVKTIPQVESEIGAILHADGLSLLAGNSEARMHCQHDANWEQAAGLERKPHFVMLWQSAKIDNLPPELQKRIASGKYQSASVGACTPLGDSSTGSGTFTAYRVAVLLY